MKTHLTTPILIPALALVLLAAAFVGYQAVSAQILARRPARGSDGPDGRTRRRPRAPELGRARRRLGHRHSHRTATPVPQQ